MEKTKKNNPIIRVLQKKSLTIYLLLLILLLITGTSAWMIYSNTVSTDIDVHVKAWNIEFVNDIPETISDNYAIEASDVYPGMDEFTSGINILNSGELKATLSYTILSVQLFDENVIYTREGAEKIGLAYDASRLTSEQMEDKLKNGYPFAVEFILTNPTFEEIDENNNARLVTKITWPYERINYSFQQKVDTSIFCNCALECDRVESETAHACYDTECNENSCYTTKILELADEEDTEWGKRAYNYNSDGEKRPAVKINMVLKATQDTE